MLTHQRQLISYIIRRSTCTQNIPLSTFSINIHPFFTYFYISFGHLLVQLCVCVSNKPRMMLLLSFFLAPLLFSLPVLSLLSFIASEFSLPVIKYQFVSNLILHSCQSSVGMYTVYGVLILKPSTNQNFLTFQQNREEGKLFFGQEVMGKKHICKWGRVVFLMTTAPPVSCFAVRGIRIGSKLDSHQWRHGNHKKIPKYFLFLSLSTI